MTLKQPDLTPPVTVPCACCGGSGRVELTGELLLTYRAVESAESPEVTGAELGRHMGVRETAMNNRLAALENKGLLISRRWGRQKFYRVKP